MSEDDDLADWIAECAGECSWQLTTAFKWKAEDRADVHTATTGHPTEVNIAGRQEPPC